MNIDQLAQMNAIEPCTDFAHISALKCLEELDNLVDKVSLRNSKPFHVRNEILTPTLQLYQFDLTLRKLMNTTAQPNSFLTLNELANGKSTSLYVLRKIQNMLNQNKWFELSSINQHFYKAQINSELDALWNEIRGYKSSRDVQLDNDYRSKLIREQRTENSKIVSRLLKKYSKLQVRKLFFNMNLLGDCANLAPNQIEKKIYELKTQLISQLQRLNNHNLYCIQWRVQRSLSGVYYLNLLIYFSVEKQLSLEVDYSQLIDKFGNDESSSIAMNQGWYSMHTIGLENNPGPIISLEQWKVLFHQMLYPLNYYYYQSKVISPKFSSIIY
jgi:hypothetical protein